jgi:hypothetical protein
MEANMRRIAIIFVAFAIFFPSSALKAQQIPPTTVLAQRDAQALTVLTQSLSAMGVVNTTNQTTLAVGTATYPDGTSKPVRMETIGNNRIRHDVGTNDFTFVSNAWAGYLIIQGQKQPLRSWVTAYQRPEHIPGLSLMSDYQNANLQLRYVGLENINGSPAHHLRLSMLPTDNTPQDIADLISEFHVWIDQSSLLVVKTTHFDFSPEAIENRTPVDVFYSDYRQINGSTLPFHLTRWIANQVQMDIQFSTISLTAAVSATDFQ